MVITMNVTDAATETALQSQAELMSMQHMPPRCNVYTPDLEQSGQHNPNRARPKTEISPWATLLKTLMRQADTTAEPGRGVGVTAHYHNFLLPLPAQPLTIVLPETDAHEHRCTSLHRNQAYVQHTKTHRTLLKLETASCFSFWLIVSLPDDCCQLSWQK